MKNFWVKSAVVVGQILWMVGASETVQAFETIRFSQKGAFERGVSPVDAQGVRWGFVKRPGDVWQVPTETAIRYESAETGAKSRELRLEIPELYEGWVIAYRLGAVADGWQGKQVFWSEERFINPRTPEGEFVTLPLVNSAFSDFSPSNFELRGCPVVVQGSHWKTSECPVLGSGVRLQAVHYGFTIESFTQHSGADVSWWNSFGEASAEGTLTTWGERHSNGYKGTMYRVFPHWVRVPEGMNLVYRAVYEESQTGARKETAPLYVDLP